MGVVKVLCAATVAALAFVHVADLSDGQRIAIRASLRRVFGADPDPATKIVSTATRDLPPPREASPAVTGIEIIEPDHDGQFNASAEIEGERFPVLIDTGASMVSLTSEVADRLAYRPSPSDFRYSMNTANGKVNYAKVILPELRLGTLAVRDVPAMVAPPGALFRSLLGMSFLTRLSSFRTDGGRLSLQQ